MDHSIFPFTAIAGQEAMKSALLINAVDPSVGGVLIRGHKGTGKSTAVRALANLLPTIEVVSDCPFNCHPEAPALMHPECRERFERGESLPGSLRPTPMVDLPLSATEDRVVGTLHLQRALQTGERRLEPGLLAAAHRGILYVDEVNLLADHLVDLLLDAAASGVNLVEREGLHYRHPARFLLVGTMNPEEGTLRPQFLDRFGLCVSVAALQNADHRRTVVRRRLAFEENPEDFHATWKGAEQELAAQIVLARSRLEATSIPDRLLDLAVQLSLEAKVHGHRAEITVAKTARALAALQEKEATTEGEIAEAARFVLPHRMAVAPLEPPEKTMERLEDILVRFLGDTAPQNGNRIRDDRPEDLDFFAETMEVPGATAAGSMLFTFLKKKLKSGSSAPMNPFS